MKRVTLAIWLWASISSVALAESPVSRLTEAQFENLVAQLKTIYDERQPDVVLFGEDHCQVQPYQFLAAEATIEMHAGAHFVGAFIEEPAESQPWYDRIIANSLVKNPTPEQRRAAEALEEKMIRVNVNSSAVDCPAGVTPANAAADVAMAKRLTAHDMAYRASDYTGDASEALQDQFAKTHDPALRKRFDAVRLDERRAAKLIRAAMSIGHVFAIRGAKHFLQKSDTAMRENLAGLKVLTFIFDDTGHIVGNAEASTDHSKDLEEAFEQLLDKAYRRGFEDARKAAVAAIVTEMTRASSLPQFGGRLRFRGQSLAKVVYECVAAHPTGINAQQLTEFICRTETRHAAHPQLKQRVSGELRKLNAHGLVSKDGRKWDRYAKWVANTFRTL